MKNTGRNAASCWTDCEHSALPLEGRTLVDLVPIRATAVGNRRCLRKRTVSIVLILLGVSTMFIASVRESKAIPAFARKYQANCAMCHFPVYPRLNNFGQQYRRAGYRTPIEFGESQDFTKVNELLSAKLRQQFAYENKEGEIERTEFKNPEISFFYSGAVSQNFSGWIHVVSQNGKNPDLHGHIQGIFGSSDQFAGFRIGQMHLLSQEAAGGFDRSTGLSVPQPHRLPLTTTGLPVSYTFDQRQDGLELSYVRGPGRLLVQITNGLDESGSGTGNIGDNDSDKDYMVASDFLLDDIASGLTVLYYHGTTRNAADQEFNYWRTGLNVSKWFPLPGFGFVELQGAYYRSHDNNPAGTPAGTSIDGNAFYVESQQYITGPEVTFYQRFSYIDQDDDRRDTTRQDVTVGAVTPLQMWLRLTAEYTYTDNEIGSRKDHEATLELQLNF